jgi:hypothetical protein
MIYLLMIENARAYSALRFLVLFDFFADISKVVFIEIMTFQGNDGFCLIIVINIMIGTVSLEVISALV